MNLGTRYLATRIGCASSAGDEYLVQVFGCRWRFRKALHWHFLDVRELQEEMPMR